MRTPYDRSGRRRVSREAEIPRLRRGRRGLRDREACDPAGLARGRGSRPEPMNEEDGDEIDDRYSRGRRSRRYSREPLERAPRGRRAIETAGVRRRALRDLPMRRRDAVEEEDDFMDLDLDAILEVPEDEIEEEFPGEMGDEMGEEKPGKCPAGCVPEEAVDEILEEEGEEDEKGEDKDEEKEDEKEDEGEEDEKDAKEDEKEDKKEAAVEPEVKPEPKPEVNTAKWAPLFSEADVKRLDKSAEVVMVPFLHQEDPSYVVLANGRPVGEIRESDLTQVDPEDRHALFTAEAFPRGIMQAAEQLGAADVLNDLGLRYYANLVTQRQADDAAKTAVQADLEEAFQTRAAALKQNFINNVLLAIEASNKNLFIDNDLRDAVRVNFRDAGVPDAVVVDLFEDAMQKAGANYFRAMVEKADEWLGFEKDAMQQIEATIRGSRYAHPADRGLPIEADVNEPPRTRTVPVRTMQPQQREAVTSWDGDEAAVRRVLRDAGTLKRGR